MRIACSICVLFALSFPRTVSAEESGKDEDVKKLAKKVKNNYRIIRSIGERATNLEDRDVFLGDEVEKLNEDLVDAVAEFDLQVASLKEDITDLGGKFDTTTDNLDDLNGTVEEVEGKVIELNGTVINFDGKVTRLKEKLDGTIVNVTGLDEDITDLSSHLEDQDGKIKKLELLIEDLMKLNNIFGGYEYLFIESKLTWAAHKTAARNWGGHLASVHSLSEHIFILQRMTQVLYLGGQRISINATDGSDKTWKWSDETNWDYSVWTTYEPNNAYHNSAVVEPNTDMWHDRPSSALYGGVYKRPYP